MLELLHGTLSILCGMLKLLHVSFSCYLLLPSYLYTSVEAQGLVGDSVVAEFWRLLLITNFVATFRRFLIFKLLRTTSIQPF